MVVSFLAGHTENFGTFGSEQVVKFSGGITVVVAVGLLVTDTKDGNLLSINVEVGEGIVEPVIPRGSRSLLVGSSVPGRGTDDEGIGSGDLGIGCIANVIGTCTDFVSDVCGDGFGVSGGSGVVKPDCIQCSVDWGLVHGWSKSFSRGHEGGGNDGVAGKHFDDVEFV